MVPSGAEERVLPATLVLTDWNGESQDEALKRDEAGRTAAAREGAGWIEAADKALYKAKQEGRDRAVAL